MPVLTVSNGRLQPTGVPNTARSRISLTGCGVSTGPLPPSPANEFPILPVPVTGPGYH